MGTSDAALWKEVDQLLRRRPGWRFQVRSTPGAPPAWCFGREVDPALTVSVEDGAISVSQAGTDADVALGSSDELLAWLIDHWPEALPEQRVRPIDKLRRGRLFEWE